MLDGEMVLEVIAERLEKAIGEVEEAASGN